MERFGIRHRQGSFGREDKGTRGFPAGFGTRIARRPCVEADATVTPASVNPRPAARPRRSRRGLDATKGFLKRLGPGLITGASDDDPSGIGTYSQIGAKYGYAMLWTMPFLIPPMAAIQEISARIGRITGRGLAGQIPRPSTAS